MSLHLDSRISWASLSLQYVCKFGVDQMSSAARHAARAATLAAHGQHPLVMLILKCRLRLENAEDELCACTSDRRQMLQHTRPDSSDACSSRAG